MQRTARRSMDATDVAELRKRILRRATQVDSGCLLWNKDKGNGYGDLRFKYVLREVHVWSYLAWNGTIPANHHIDHTCNTGLCVEPSHLEAVTQSENNRRMNARGRNGMSKKTHCPRGHAYTKENTQLVRNGSGTLSRRCRTCRRVSSPKSPRRGEKNGKAVISSETVKQIRNLSTANLSGYKIANSLGVTPGVVYSVLSKRTWSHVV